MTALLLLLKAWLALNAVMAVRWICVWRKIDSIAFPAATVLFLCFGIWEMGQ